MSTRVPRGQLESFVKRYCNVTSFPPFASSDVMLDTQSSVAATRNRVKNISEIRSSTPTQRAAPPARTASRRSLIHLLFHRTATGGRETRDRVGRGEQEHTEPEQ